MIAWSRARGLAHELGAARPRRVLTLPVDRAAGSTLAADARARRALPRFDNSAMDGWAVAGDAPWRVGEPVLAGHAPPSMPLSPGEARPIATGAPVPPGTVTVLRTEDAIPQLAGSDGLLDTLVTPDPGRDIRRMGEEAMAGEVLLAAGSRLTPPALGLLLAAGVQEVTVASPPDVSFIAIGDELGGAESPGHVTDSLTPMMPAVLAALGGRCATAVRTPDDPARVAHAISRGRTQLVVTAGGTAHGPADPLRTSLRLLDAPILLDGVDLRPGGSVLIADLGDGRTLLGLPGNPLAAIVDLLVLGWPLLQGRLGGGIPPLSPWADAMDGLAGARVGLRADGRDRAIACALVDGSLEPVRHQRSGMLRGIASATHLALVSDSRVDVMHLPW